jgi:uncharacterized protein
VTPVERVGIAVEDVPFLAVEMAVEGAENGATLHFRTNVDDVVAAGRDHPLRFTIGAAGGLTPYVHVRGALWARLTRAATYSLVERGEERLVEGTAMFGVASGADFFPMTPMSGIDDLP